MNSFILEAALVTRERCSHGAVRRPTHFGRGLPRISSLLLTIGLLGFATSGNSNASPEEDAKAVAALDTKYQAAVKANDAATMDQILADNFTLVTGRGAVFSKADLLDSARKKEVTYERQDEEPGTQKVRVWGDTAVVTALLWIKSVQAGKPADYKLWFSDTYVRTPTGWRYVFGQASLPLPKSESPANPPAREKPSE